MHRDLLRLRRTDPAFRAQAPRGLDGAVLGVEAFALRFFAGEGEDRLVLVNLGADLALAATPEPLLAPPADHLWRTIWSSDDARYGGPGVPPIETRHGWRLPGQATVVLAPAPSAGMDDPVASDEESEEAETRREALRRLGA